MIGHAYCTCCLWISHSSRLLAVSAGLAVRNLLQCLPASLLEQRPFGGKRQTKLLELTSKIGIQLCLRFCH